MRILIIGAGGTGGYFGAKLARAGVDVTFLARGAHLEAMRAHGIHIRSAIEGEWSVPVRALETLESEPPADLVFFCVKSFDTESAAQQIRAVVGPHTGVLSIQNGVENEDIIARIVGGGHVLGGITHVFSHIEEPGVIAHHLLGRIAFGEMDGRVSDRVTAFAEACRRAEIPIEISENIRRTLWEKFLTIVPIQGATSLTRLPVKFIREVPETRRFWQMEVDELLAIAECEGAGLPAGMRDRCARFLESLAPNTYSSLYQDLAQGKRLELEALHGCGVRRGAVHHIPTPALFAVYAALKPFINGRPDV